MTKRQPQRRNAGYTLVELMVVVLLTSVGASIGVKVSVGAMDGAVVKGARTAYGSLHARARAQAVHRGVGVTFVSDANVDSVWVSEGDSLVAAIGFSEEFGVDLQSDPARIKICMNSRGLTDLACNSFQVPVDLDFVKGDDTSQARVRPFGHLTIL